MEAQVVSALEHKMFKYPGLNPASFCPKNSLKIERECVAFEFRSMWQLLELAVLLA